MWKIWFADKAWELMMRLWPKRKSPVDTLAALQLRERELESHLPEYKRQIEFAFAALAKDHPGGSAMSIPALIKAIDEKSDESTEIIALLVKKGFLQPFPGNSAGDTHYTLRR